VQRTILLVAVTMAALVAVYVLLTVPLSSAGPGSSGRVVGGHPLFGETAPEIDLATLEGDRIRLSDLRGQPLLINFWATWCLPCRDEFPLMVVAYDEYRDDGLEILGIVHDDAVDGARRFAAGMGAEWPMLDDPDDVAFEAYTVPGMPTSYFVDAEGIVRAFSIGGFSEAGLASHLGKILPESSQPS
jgi:cytochrome c biogenesis protein CcmG/thiol:disulfide interchange protein DsbE